MNIYLKPKIFRALKLSTLCLILGVEAGFATESYSQKTTFTISVQDQSVKEVFDYIEQHSEFIIFYLDETIDVNRKVSVNLKDQRVESILEQLFKNTDVMYTINDRQILLSKRKEVTEAAPVVAVVQQKKNTVTGVVLDPTGMPVIGANIMVKGTTSGTITDMDGKFSLDVDKDATLVVSYIGFASQEIKVGNQVNLSITLKEDVEALEEILVIGYGSMSKKDVTSSISTIKSKDLNNGVYTNPGQMLQGKVPGLTVVQSSDPNGGVLSMTLRGASTLRSGASSPYYVIDGIPGMDISLVAPDDIESIDVLRDATATAIYGSKAANGVIIITTKKGKEGRTNINYSGYVAFDNVAKELDMMTASELREYAQNNNLQLNNDDGADTNWHDEVMRTAISHNHNLSISGGTKKSIFNASFNYVDKEGIIRGTDMDRINARAFMETKALNDKLTVSMNVNASISNSKTVPGGVYDAVNYYSPLAPVKNPDGSWFNNSSISMNYNPVSMINEDKLDSRDKNIQGVGKASLNIIDGLTWNAVYSYSNGQSLSNSYHSTKSQIDKFHGNATRSTFENTKSVFETYVNYDKVFKDIHKLSVMLGYSWEESSSGDGFSLTVKDFYNDELGYHNLGVGNKIELSDIPSSSYSILRMISFYGRLNYAFNSKYMLQTTVRRDGSSAFGKNNRWATFPSASLAWRLSEESFVKEIDIFDDLKLRIGYGVSGNSFGFDAFTANMTYGPSGFFTYTDKFGKDFTYRTLAPMRNTNPDLKWESTSMFNVGLDFSFWGGRLNGSIEYYDKNTRDLIYNYPVSTNRYQYDSMIANVGNINNKGFELSINAVPVKIRDFEWTTNLNLSHNKNVVKKLSNEEYSVDYIDTANPGIAGNSYVQIERIMEGMPIGTFYMWEWAGYNDDGVSVFVDRDENGNAVGTTLSPGEEDRSIQGFALPKLNLGWNNTFVWKRCSLVAFFQGVFGNKIYNATRDAYNNVGFVQQGKNILKEVPYIQKSTDINAHVPSNRYLENGSYLRLSQLTLGYNYGNIGNWIKNLDIYFTINNVFTFTGYEGCDPEMNLGGLEPGIDNRAYPRTRSFLIGLKVNF